MPRKQAKKESMQDSFLSYGRQMKANPILVGVDYLCNKTSTKHVENILYSYPVWEVSIAQNQALSSSVRTDTTWKYSDYWKSRSVDPDYLKFVKLVESTLSILSHLQREFVKMRYFSKKPFKIIAEDLAVTERHLYRIRNETLRIFAVAFGW